MTSEPDNTTRSVYIGVAGAVAGNRLAALSAAFVGATVILNPEPDNPHDTNAIGVYLGRDIAEATKIGYVPAVVAKRYLLDHPILGSISDIRHAPDEDENGNPIAYAGAPTGCDVRVDRDDLKARP